MIAVLCGGDGREREVSLRSGKAVCDALNDSGLSAECLDIKTIDEAVRACEFDGAFIAMHGDWGEGGGLQAKLEELGVPYTGSGPKASALAMNKWQAREVFIKSGLPVPKGILLPASYEAVMSELGGDVVVKPCSGGSTVGISVIHGLAREELDSAVRNALASYEGDVMIEEYIPGREITCAVWEHEGKPEALPVIEIVPHSGYYDYSNKYTAGATEYIVPAKIDPKISETIAGISVKAHEALGCSGYSRADLRLRPDGAIFLLEVNTAPGMTATSLVPKAARACGVNMSEFVSKIMMMALPPKSRQIMYTPKPADTSAITLPSELLELTGLMARNTHDTWAAQRILEGWTYGDHRDDTLKTTPCLVPYEDLPESEKDYDRKTAIETIKLLLKLGYKIQCPDNA